MRISIVIPVYNEAEHLAACLDAIALQTVPPYEVIVVDNNSSDDSAAIAARYPFVRIITEPRQGVVFARNRGFNAARGAIIGRIDADTIVTQEWVATLQQLFVANSNRIDAVSGAVTYHDLPWKRFLGGLDLGFRQWIANGLKDDVFLYGSNMAVRRTAWLQARNLMCAKSGLHEDFDLAIHLNQSDAKVVFDRRLQAAVSLRRFNVSFGSYFHYVWLSPQTYRQHNRSAGRMYPVVALVTAGYFVIQLLYRCYEPKTDSLSPANFSAKRTALRVNPATFVD